MGKTGVSTSHSILPNFLAALILFFSATQLGLHFWPLSSLVYGVRVDYLSPTIYLLDLLLLGYLIVRRSVLNRNSWLQAKKGSAAAERTGLYGALIWSLPLLLTNLLFSVNPLATLSWSLHFLLYFLFVSSLSSRLISSSSFLIPLVVSMMFQVALATAQVALGHSVGRQLYYLGERTVAVGSPGVASAVLWGQTALRAYGTFGHPNVLAGWLVVCLLILIQASQTATPSPSNQRAARGPDLNGSAQPRIQSGGEGQTLWAPTSIAALGILLTQSRAAAFVLFGIVIPLYLFKSRKLRATYFAVLFLLTIGHRSLVIPNRSDLSRTQRLDLQGVSLKVVRALPVFGTGVQASISTYPQLSLSMRLLQPDHNSFTLLLSWFGVFGLLAILYSLRYLIPHFSFLIPILPLFLLDHYLLTSPQGLFILLLYAKLSSCSK